MSEQPLGQKVSETSRVEAFSDGVFAIAITLLVLDLKVSQDVPAGQLPQALIHAWPSYLAFVASFFTIGVMWINHHRMFSLIRRSDDVLLALNLLLLFGVTVVPFPTALLAEHLRGPDQRVAALVYSGMFLVIALIFNGLWRYASRGGRLLEGMPFERIRSITRQYSAGPLLYFLILIVGLFDATACLVASALIAIYFALPPRLWRGRAEEDKAIR